MGCCLFVAVFTMPFLSRENAGTGALSMIAWFFGGLTLYFLPAQIARKKKNATAILLLNIFTGWTFIGWVAALVWASTKD